MSDAPSGPSDSTIDVLVVKPSSLGDIIHAAGAVAALAQACPSCRIAWVVNEGYASFVREFPGVDRVVPFPRDRFRPGRLPRAVADAVAWCWKLGKSFDVAVDLQGLQRSALITRCSGAPERFGSQAAREFAWLHYNRRIDIAPAGSHAVDQLYHVVEQVLARSRHFEGDTPTPIPRPATTLTVPEEAERAFDRRYPGFDVDVALFPGTRWDTKMWTDEGWSGLAIGLARSGMRVTFLGAPFEQALVDRILSHVPAQDGVGSMMDLDLWETAAVMSRVKCAVTLDSAPLHLAAALGTPTVSLFGPTDPARFAPRGEQHRVVRHEALDCLGCHKKRCPLPERRCLPEMEAQRVAQAVRELLGQAR